MHRQLTSLLLLVALALAGCAPQAQPPTPPPTTPAPEQPQTPNPKPPVTDNKPGGLSAFAFLDAPRVWVADGNRLLASTDGGLHFTALAELPGAPTALGFADADRGWAALDQGLYASSDGGKTWAKVDLKLPGQLAGMSFAADGHGALVGTGASLISRDSGRTWQRIETGCAAGESAQLSWLGGESAGLICTAAQAARQGYGVPQLTRDGGKTWRPVSLPCGGFASVVSPQVGFTLCAGQPGAGAQAKDLFATADGGEHWQQMAGSQQGQQLPRSGYASGLFFLDADHGWLTEDRGGLVATADGGRTWNALPVPPPGEEHFLGPVRFFTPLQGYLVARTGGQSLLLATADGGKTWAQLYPAPARPN